VLLRRCLGLCGLELLLGAHTKFESTTCLFKTKPQNDIFDFRGRNPKSEFCEPSFLRVSDPATAQLSAKSQQDDAGLNVLPGMKTDFGLSLLHCVLSPSCYIFSSMLHPSFAHPTVSNHHRDLSSNPSSFSSHVLLFYMPTLSLRCSRAEYGKLIRNYLPYPKLEISYE